MAETEKSPDVHFWAECSVGLSLPLCKGAGQLRWSLRSPLPAVKPSFGVESTLFPESPTLLFRKQPSVPHSVQFCFHKAKRKTAVTQNSGAQTWIRGGLV